MPCFDRPYTITDTDEENSTVTLDLPNSTNIYPTFHTSQVISYIESDTEKFLSWHFEEPDPIITEEGNEEQYIDRILDAWWRGQGYQYLVQWCGFGQEHDEWLLGSELQDCEVLEIWLASQNGSP